MRKTVLMLLALWAPCGCQTPTPNVNHDAFDIRVEALKDTKYDKPIDGYQLQVDKDENGVRFELECNPINVATFNRVLAKIWQDNPAAQPRLVIYVQSGVPMASTLPLLQAAQKYHVTNVVLRLDEVRPRWKPRSSEDSDQQK